MFIKPKCRKIKLKDETYFVNPVVNMNLCKYFSFSSITHETKSNIYNFESIILPSILFEGCDISWVFDTQSEQKEEYDRLTKILC